MNNFSFLLIICDEIQEWSRPVAKRRIYYEIEKEKPEIVSIHNFNNKTIDISIKLNLVEDEIEKYSIIKFQNFIRLLRSAVDSDSRTFDFKLLIKNYEEIEFIFEYDNPHDFYKGGVSEEEQYNPPRIEKKQPDGTPDPNFTLKSITEF